MMKPYDPNAKCPKCHHKYIKTSWQPQRIYPHASNLDMPLTLKEHMQRWCEHCHYAWAEAPLDIAYRKTVMPIENLPPGIEGRVVSQWRNDDSTDEKTQEIDMILENKQPAQRKSKASKKKATKKPKASKKKAKNKSR